MKRPLGWIGLCFLSILAVIFWFGEVWIPAIVIASAVLTVAGIVLKTIRKGRRLSAHFVAVGVTSFAAVSLIFLYQNYYVQPILDNYSDKEINIKGYVCDEITLTGKICSYPIQVEEIDGKPVSLKLQINAYTDYDVEEFDVIEATVLAGDSGTEKLYSRKIFLSAYEGDGFRIAATGETHRSPYRVAVTVRKGIKRILGDKLSPLGAGVARAVLLGDKDALDSSVREDFTRTGTSYLIVVSGMHLLVMVGFVLLLLRNRNKWIRSSAAVVTAFLFAAVTGFSPSVVRAAICTGITFAGYALLRTADGINSLGVAALVLTVTNPCAVGDIGMLLSFAATFGILLWAEPIYGFLKKPLHLDVSKHDSRRKRKVKWFFAYFVRLFSASVSATLWTLPISALAFGRFSPFVVVISLVASPLTSIILVLTALLTVISVFPSFHMLSGISALVLEGLSRLLVLIIGWFAGIPFSSVKGDEPFIYIWIAVSAVLIAAGYLIHRKIYIPFAVCASLLTLTFGWLFAEIFADTATTLTVMQSGSGAALAVRRLDDISLLGCSGQAYVNRRTADRLSLISTELDALVLPNKYYNRSQLTPYLNTFEIKTAAVYELDTNNIDRLRAAGIEPFIYDKQTSFSVALNSEVSDRVISTKTASFQYLQSEQSTALIVPNGADAEDLPKEYRVADLILFDGKIKHADCLRCHTLVYFGKSDKTEVVADMKYEEAVLVADGEYTVRLE